MGMVPRAGGARAGRASTLKHCTEQGQSPGQMSLTAGAAQHLPRKHGQTCGREAIQCECTAPAATTWAAQCARVNAFLGLRLDQGAQIHILQGPGLVLRWLRGGTVGT